MSVGTGKRWIDSREAVEIPLAGSAHFDAARSLMQRRSGGMLLSIPLLALVFAATPLSAAPTGAFAFNGRAHLNSGFPCLGGCNGTFDGTARGIAAPGLNCLSGCVMTAFYNYAEPLGSCVGGVPFAPTGTASGSYSIGSLSGLFVWTRVGVTAVILLSDPFGVAVASFTPPTASCLPGSASVAGIALTI